MVRLCVDILDDVVRLGVGVVQASVQVKGHIQKVHYLMIAINFNPEAIVAKKFTQFLLKLIIHSSCHPTCNISIISVKTTCHSHSLIIHFYFLDLVQQKQSNNDPSTTTLNIHTPTTHT